MENSFWIKAFLLCMAVSSFSFGLHSSQKKKTELTTQQKWDTSNEVDHNQISIVSDTLPVPKPDTLPVPEPPPIPIPVPPDTVPLIR